MQMLTFHNVDNIPAEPVIDAFLLLVGSFLSIRCICSANRSFEGRQYASEVDVLFDVVLGKLE